MGGNGNLFEELKRRNVFRVGVAYLVVGWLVAQILDLGLDSFAAPDWVMKTIIAVLLAGLPVALVFAWIFERTPEGVKRTQEVAPGASVTPATGHKLDRFIIGALAVALAYFIWESRFQDSAPPEPEHSIAVLPFVNMSEDKANEYFSDGLSEELLNVLVKLPGLKVAGRTSSFAFKGRSTDLRTIGEQLGVSHILEGSVRKQRNRVRITAQLIRADDGFHLWSKSYDRELADIFAVQEEIANAISNVLAIKLDLRSSGSLVTARTENMEAYDRYLEAKVLIARRGKRNFTRAIEILEEATSLDPGFAAAWGTLAVAHTLAHYYDVESKPEALARGEAAARRALALDSRSSPAHGALASILRDKRQWVAAEDEYLLALELDPRNVEANEQYAQFLGRTGRFSAALPYAARARQLDPLGPVYVSVEGWLRYSLGEKDAGRDLLDRSVRLRLGNIGYGGGVRFLALVPEFDTGTLKRELKFKLDRTRQEYGDEAILFDPENLNILDDPIAARLYLQELRGEARIDPERVAEDFWALSLAALAITYGDNDLALDFLELQVQNGLDNVVNLDPSFTWFPVFGALQSSPRMKRMREAAGLPAYWRQRGWPDVCRPLGDDDFECG